MRLRSDEQYLGIERSLQRAWAKGAGLIDEEFEQPMIAVVNTYWELSPENVRLRQVGEAVKAGIFKNRTVFLETVYDGVGKHLLSRITEEELRGYEDNHFPFSGARGTATSGDTAGIYTEALGLSLPHSGTFPAGSNYQLRAAKYTGMKALGDLIHPDTSTVSGTTTRELTVRAEIEHPECIRGRPNPVEVGGSIYILKGSLAPGGAVVKTSGVSREMWQAVLPARVFEDEESAIDAVRSGDIRLGTCVVIRRSLRRCTKAAWIRQAPHMVSAGGAYTTISKATMQ